MPDTRSKMNEVRLHIESLDQFFAGRQWQRDASTMAICARGPRRFHSKACQHLLKVLTPKRWALLRRLRALGASSVRALARSLGRDYRGVHADVAVLHEVGLIEKQADGKMLVPWSRITAEMSVDIAA
jgi:hypothetical protein